MWRLPHASYGQNFQPITKIPEVWIRAGSIRNLKKLSLYWTNVCLQFMNNEQHGKVLLYSPSVWSWWGHRIYPSPAGFPRGGCSWSPSPWGWGWTLTAPPWTPSSCTCFPSGRTSREVWPTMEEDCSWLRIECFCPHTVKENHFCLTILLSQIDIVWQNYSRYM